MVLSFIGNFVGIRKTIIVVLTMIFIFVSSISYALDGLDAGSDYFGSKIVNVFVFVVDHAAAPLAGIVTGALACGLPCAVIFGSIGAFDEYLNVQGYEYDYRLTWGLVGIMLGDKVAPGDVGITHFLLANQP